MERDAATSSTPLMPPTNAPVPYREFEPNGRGLAAPACEDGCADLLFFLPPSVLMSCADLVTSDSFKQALGITNVDCEARRPAANFERFRPRRAP